MCKDLGHLVSRRTIDCLEDENIMKYFPTNGYLKDFCNHLISQLDTKFVTQEVKFIPQF